jgi:hypothetical protein
MFYEQMFVKSIFSATIRPILELRAERPRRGFGGRSTVIEARPQYFYVVQRMSFLPGFIAP